MLPLTQPAHLLQTLPSPLRARFPRLWTRRSLLFYATDASTSVCCGPTTSSVRVSPSCVCAACGTLTSVHPANLVLQDTVERVYVGQQYGEIPLGVYLVRGENVVLLGEVDLEREDEIPPQIAAPFPLGQFTGKDLDKMRRAETEARQARHAADAAVLKRTHAFAEHGDEGDQY